jgi:hypothetical protein
MSKPIALRLAVAVLAAGLSTAAFAEDFAKDHLASARAAIEASHVSDGIDNILIVVAQQTKQLLVRTNPSLSAQIDEVTNAAAIGLAGRRPDLDRQIQEIWAARFSKAELDEIARFYNSETGRKLTKETTGIIQMTGVAAQVWQQKIGQELLAKVREEMKKRGVNL